MKKTAGMLVVVAGLLTSPFAGAEDRSQESPPPALDMSGVPTKLGPTLAALRDIPDMSGVSFLQRLDRSIALFAVALSSSNPKVSISESETAIRDDILRLGLSEGLVVPLFNLMDQAASQRALQVYGRDPTQTTTSLAVASLGELSPKAAASLTQSFGLSPPSNIGRLPAEPASFRQGLMGSMQDMKIPGGGYGRDLIDKSSPMDRPRPIYEIMFGPTSAFGHAGTERARGSSGPSSTSKTTSSFSDQGFDTGPFGGAFCVQCASTASGTSQGGRGNEANSGQAVEPDSENDRLVGKGKNWAEKTAVKQVTKRSIEWAVIKAVAKETGKVAGTVVGVVVDVVWPKALNAPVPGGALYNADGVKVGTAPADPPPSSSPETPKGSDSGTSPGSKPSGSGKGDESGGPAPAPSGAEESQNSVAGGGKIAMDDGETLIRLPGADVDSPRGESVGILQRSDVPRACRSEFSSEECFRPWAIAASKRLANLEVEERQLKRDATQLKAIIDDICMSAKCLDPIGGTSIPATGRLGRPTAAPERLGDATVARLDDRSAQLLAAGNQYGRLAGTRPELILYLDAASRIRLQILMEEDAFVAGLRRKGSQEVPGSGQ